MGNVCGCVRGHKDECYVDPSKAPFSPASKELKGRRYFQRRKSRKSVEFQPEETVKNQSESEKNEKFCDFIDQGVYVGEVPVVLAGRRPGVHQSEIDRSQVTIEENLHKFTKGSRFIAPKNRLLEKKLLQRQLRRAASFGAVEHLLRSLRGHGSRKGSVDYQWKDARGLSRIICDIQVQRKRAYTSSGGSFSQCSLDTIQNKSPFHNEREISDIHVSGESEDMTAKERLLLWSQQMTEGYVGVRCDNFTTSWKDGRLFNAIIHKYRPDLVDMSKVSTQSSRTNLEQAFIVAEQLGVARLLDPEDVDITTPDEKSVITYVSTLYDVFPKVPEGVEGISANDVDVKWVEYQNMVNYLSQWIKHNVTVMSDRNFPCNPVELKALYLQYLHFKESEIPLKENEKTKIKHLYKMLEVWIEFGRIHLPEGYHPNDVEKEWGKLIVAMLEREKSLRPEVDRLEMLQQIADRVKRDCVAGEDKLVFARASLQSDIKRLESGIQLQNEPEIAGYLLECENLLRQQVVDIQILLDGKFYLADQLVQRVSKLRDHLLTLRTECSSVYSQGRSLSTEQTKMMISGITQSLNSGFSQNLNMGLSPALTPGSAFSTSFTPAMTPGLTPALTSALIPGLQPTLRVGGSMEPGILQHMKHMQIRKPMLKASLVDPSLSEEEVNMKFVQDLLNWVEEMQGQLDQGEWGSDLPSVESHLENHRNVHKAIEDFQMSIKEAQMSEMQMTHPLKLSYSDKLNILESQYGRLLNSAKERQKYLDSLHNFVSHATQELIWLNEREEEEVAFDWSERNSNISRKKDYHAELMRELDEKEGVIKSVQDQADILLQQNHPARLTIEAYKAAMQTQWSWILQLCYCVEQHLKENATYIEFFSDAKESMDYLKSLQDSITRKYGCDRTSSLHRLEDLIQESMDEKEQLLQYRSTVAGLVGRSKSIVQLKPRNPENPVRTSVPVKSICDYRQIEITIYKDDECVLANNSHRAKWKVISPSGNEAMVPSVCFTVPPPNKEAADMASRIEQLYQKVLALWHRSHVNMKSVVSWHYLMLDIRNIRKSTVASIKTMLPGEHQQVLSSLQSHFEEFLEDSEESEVFTMADCTQLEREVLASKESYEELLKSAEREEHEESVYNVFISEVRNFRMRVEAHEEQLIRQIRSPLERDDSKAIMQRIADQERKKAELDRLSEDLVVLKEKCEEFLRQAANSPSVPTLSSELNVLTQSMAQVYSMCSIYLEKLKTVNLVVKHSQGAEALVKLYEGKLCEEDAVNGDTRSIDAVMSTLKQWRSEIDERRDVFHDLEDELQKARAISDRMFKTHNERDFDLDWQKEKAEQLVERWRNVHSQIENRLRDLEGMSKSLKYYKDAYSNLDEWTKEMEVNQLKTQENQPEDSKALAELLNQQKVLVAEIEHKQSKIDECQKYSEQYSVGVKDYELQLMTYRAMVDSQHKSPVKRRRIQSSSDTIQQDFMDLRTRYTALVTLMTQYVKFASETLKRAEEDEQKTCMGKAEYRSCLDSMELQKVARDEEISRLRRQVLELEASLSDRQQQLDILGGELEMQKKCIDELNVQKTKAEYEAQQYRVELEGAIRSRTAIEQELKNSRQYIQQTEARQLSLEESLRMLRKNIEDSTLARRKLEDHLRRKDNDVQDLEEHRRSLEKELKAKEGAEANLLNQVRTMEIDLVQKSESRLVHGESRKEVVQKSTSSVSVPEAEALQFKVDELAMGKMKAETEIKSLKSELNSMLMQKNMADEKAQRFKELLDDANTRLMKLQVEMESDRNSIRKKSDELRQEASELRKSVYIFQEQVKSLQREKSSLEHRVQFHKTEADGLKEQLKISQGKLLQWSTNEQENCQKQRSLEEELASKQAEGEQMKFKVNELNRINQLLEGEIRHLTVSIESFQQEKSHFEQKIKTVKNESENLKEQLQKAKEEVSIKTRIEKDLQLKVKNLELELQKSDLQVTQLTKKVEELRRTMLDNERLAKNLNAELDKVNMDIGSKDQQISIFKSQAESAKSQLKIIEEELLKKTQTSHELQLKLRDYNEEVKKTSEFQQKVKTLNETIADYETDIRNLKSELTTISVERNLASQKVQEHKVEINNLNMTLQKAKNEAQKESSESKKNIAKLRELENELVRCRQTINRMTGTSEKAAVNLKLDISSLQREKQAADQKLQALKTEFDGLNLTLKKTKDELLRVTQEGKMNQSKIKELETDLQKNRLVIREINSNSDKHTANLQQEFSNLLKEKGIAEEQITTLTAEISQLKIKLDHTQEDLMQKQKETAAAKLRSQMLEDQLENCKRMLEDLKGKLELQKKGYETQLQLVQSEMEQKLALQESRMKLECDRKSKEHLHSAETIERDNRQLLQEIEKLKTLHLNALKAKQEAQKQLDSTSSQLEQLRKQKGALDLEFLKAKSKITELETEKIRVKSSITQLDNIRKENSEETARLKQMLTETKQKLVMTENEAKSSKDQIASYIKEVKSLQEKNLKLEVTYTSEIKRLKESESVNQVNHQCAKDGELAKLKTELMLTQKILSSYEEAKLNLEEELKKMKVTSEIATLKKDKVLEELKIVKQDKMVPLDKASHELRITENSISSSSRQDQISTLSNNNQSNLTEHTFTSLKSSLSDKSKSGKNQSVTFNIITTELFDGESDPSKISKPSESSLPKLQGLRGRVSIKKLIKTKIITEEIALKLKTGLITMEEVQASLAQFTGKPVSIAGIYIESGKKKVSFMDAAMSGVMAKTYAIEFLEAQAATGAIINPITGESCSASEAIDKGIIGGEFRERLTDAEKAVNGYPHGGKLLSVFQAMEERILDRHRGKGILEAQIATGGLIHPLIGMRVPPDSAIEQGLINQATLQTLFDPITNPKSFHNPETGQRAYYNELLKLCVYDVNGGVYLLPFGNDHIFTPASTHRVSVINSSTGAEMSTYEAYKANLIDKRIYLFLSQQESEWQEMTVIDSSGKLLHTITDLKSGRQFCIENALSLNILQSSELQSYRSGQMSICELADLLISRKVVIKNKHSPIAGLWDVTFKKRLSVVKGFQQNLLDRLTALKLLEAQACTGGICDPSSGYRFQIADAVHHGLLDENFARPLHQYEQAYYGIIHPQTGKMLTVGQAMRENLFPKDIGLRCLEYQLATGGLIDPETHNRVSLEEGLNSCLVDKATAAHVKDDHSLAKNITCPKTKRKISFKEALEKGVFDSHTGLLLLEATKPHNKSVEEERKEHGDKVSKLLNWMSDVNKNGKAVRDDKGSTESCNKSQIPVEEVLSKKEQVTEAIRSTQLMLNKHSDKMSEKEKCEAKEQLKLLHQAHGELSQMSVNQTPAAEQEFEVIEGILDVGKGAVLSVCRAVQTGLIDHCTGLSLLEAQLITSELILPEFHMCLGLDDAFRHNLVDEPMYKQLQDLNEANKRVQIPRYASEPLPAVAAVKDGAISERLAVRIIEIQLATGGLRVTYPGENVGLERAFEFGLIPHSLYIKILQRKNTWKDLIDPNTAEKVSLIQLVQRSIVHEETGLRVLAVKSGKDGSIAFSSGREVSILRATHEGLIDRETMLRLPSAQLSAGGIVDPRTNCKLTVEEALFEGLIDQDTASGILSHQAQNGGIINPKTGVRLTVDEAVQCDLMSSRSALLVLEKQKCFMGLLWPHSGEILNVSRSIQHEIITEKLAHEVLCNRHKIAGFYIPENSEVVDIDSAAQNGFINACTVDFLKTIQIPDMFPDVDDLNDRFSSWLVMCELQIDASERSRERLEANEKSTNAPSSLEAKQLFVSFLMMNSYMDPKSGKRLLIFDRQLNKMAKVLLEMSEIDTHASALDKDFADDLHITGTGELAVLHIDEPLPRIVEGSISEMSIDCDPYVKTIESEGLTTGSGKVFNTSLERAIKAPEIKTSESASEDTNTDACPQYHPHEINPLVSDVEKDAPLIYRENSFQAKYKDTTQCSVGCSEKTEHSNLLTEYRQRESVYDEKLKRDHVLCLLRDQIKEGGILDVISLKRYNLNDAFVTGLIDDETVLEVLALQLGRQNITRNKTVTMSVLKQAVSEGYISSHIALQIKQQQNLLSDSSEKSISASGACEMGLISDNVGRFVLDSEDAQKAPTDPNGNCDNEAGDVKSDEMSALDLSENRPDTENAVNRSEEVKQLPKNPKQMNWSLDSSFSLNTICNEEIGAIYPRAEILLANSAQLTSGLDSTFLVKTRNEDKIKKHCVEITPVVLSAEEFAKNSSNTENAMKRPDEAIHLLAPSTELTKSSDSSLTLKTVSAEEVNEKCSSNKYGLMTTAESNALLSNLTQFTSSSESSLKTVIGEGISDERFDDKSLKTENEVKQKEKASNLLSTQATQLADSLETSFILKTASDKNIIDGDFSDKGLHTEDEMITLEDSYLIANSAQINSSLDTSFKADSDDKLFHELGKRCPNSEGAVKQPEDTPLPTNSKQSTCGLDSLLLLKAGSDVEITVLEKESFEISVVNFSEKCTIQLSDMRAASKTNESPESSENVQDQEQSVLSQSVDINERQTNKYKKDPTQCTISKTDVIGLEPEHECKSGTANDHAGFKAVVTQSSHSGVSVDNETVNDIVLVNTSESMDMFKECLHSKVYTSPTSKFLPDVTLSDDSNYEQHLAEQGEVADTAIELFLPNSGFVISETNRYDAGSLECKTTITPAHIMGEESSKSVTLKPNIPPNLPHKDFKYVEHYGDKLCVNTSMMESKFPPVYEKELEQTAAKGAVNEIQRMESHALDLNERISSTAATQHDSQIFVLNERSSPVLKQSQLQEMIQEMSEPEMLKEPLGWLGTTDQGDEGSLVEGVVQPKAAAGDSCEDEIFPSAWSSQQSSKANVATTEEEEEVKFRPKECSTQHYLECVGKLQDHYDTLEDIRNDFLTRSSLAVHIEGLQDQLETAQALVAQLAAFPASLTSDLKVAEQLLNSADELIPTQVQQDLAAVFVDLKATFTDVCHLSSERHNTILQAMDAAKVNLECTFQDLLSSLEKLSSCIQDNHEIVCKLDIITTDDLETVKYRIQQNKDLEKNLSGIRQNLEDTAFDVQNFISEHAQFLNPAQNRQMLKCLSATQRAFKELMERVFTQRHALDLHLEIREDEIQQQNAVEKQKEFVAKLQELCDDLTQTENRLIGHQQQSSSAKSVGDIQQHQQENQALQKDIQVNVNALNEVISSTKKFLEENRSKLTPEQVAAIERKLEEVKCKSNMLNQRAEETRKELEKVVTTVIKQETEKVAAVEQLEETKNKIEVLLDWVSNIGKETEMAKENGNMPVEGKITGVEDDPNGNALDATDNTSQWSGEDNKELDMDQQYERLKAHHQEILSQQQDLIIATQSAQALLDKQADVLSPSEKEQLQKSIHELRECYEVSLTQAEQQMKQMQSVQEELRKFEGDYEEFGVWLQQAQEQLAELAAPTGHLTVLQEKLEKQKCFYEDVISHKGDLRFITISGQKVLDVAKACSRKERKQGLLDVDTSGTCAAVKEKLDSTATRYKAMQTQCNQLGNNLKDVVDKYKKYEDAASCLLSWLNSSEADARRQQSEPIAADPQILQRQLEETKALQGQTTGHQVALETLRKTADALITAEGDLLNNKDELQEAVDDIVERYDNLSKSVSDRNEKLQVTLTRSLSVQDGLDEMMNWMKRVEENVGEGLKVPLDSAAIADALSKEAALEQDMSSRQSSISTMKAKVKKFVETAEPVAAAALQAKMEGLTQRFDNACEKHKQKISQMEQLKDKVEQFEKTFEKVQGFVLKHSHALYETDGPGKNVNELSQLVQDINAELAEHVKDMEILNLLAKELSNSGPEGSTALIQGKMANLSNTFNTFKDTVKEKEEEVLSCQDQLGEFKVAAGVLMKWLEETKEQVPLVQPNCSEQGLGNDVKKVNGLLEEWTAKAPAVQDINSKGSALCTLISVLTSPAKARMHHKPGSAVSNGSGPGASYLTNNELILVEQNMSSINEDYSSLGELLKTRSSELNGLLLKVQGVQNEAQSTLQWLENMKKTAVSWNSEPAGKDTMKMQIERQKAYEENMLQKQQQFQELRETLLHLIEESPDSPEAGKWKNMLKQIDAGWEEVKGSVENRKQHLEESSRMLELFQTNQPQLSQWLLEKDLMMSVLGPLSMDPNMLNMQKQQVQILLKEFEGRKPQYEQLNEAAMVISSASGNQDPTGEKVKKQLDAITQKWQDLTSQLSERDALIQQAVGKTTQFQDLLRQLGESAVDLELQLNGQQTLSTQPDAVKKQLEATNAVLAKLCEEKKRLKEAESLCSELSALVTEEYLRANLTAQLESISKPFKILEDKAGKRIQHLTSTFASSQEFHRTSKDFQGWIEQMFKEQAEPQSVSAKEETLLQSLREHIAIQNALSEQEEQYNNIMREAEALLQNTEGEEKLALQGQLSALRSNWEKVKRGAMERAEKLNVAIERAKKYKEHAESLGTWLQECEDRRNKAKFSVDPVEVENSLSQVKAIQRDVDKHRGQMELLNVAAGSLLEVATADVDDLQEEKLNIGNNMDKLIEGLQLKKETLEKLSQKLKEFSDTGKEISDQMEGARKQLEYHSGLGEQGYSNKNLTNMKSQQKNLEGVQNQIENLKILAQSLIVDVPEVEGVVDLLLQADTLEKEHSSISKAIEDKCNTLENKLQGIGQFQDSIREMFTTFADLDDELDSMGPVARDLKTLQDQEGTIQNFVTKLQDLINNTASARENCKKMLESEVSPDLLGLKRDLEALSKQSGKLMDRAIGRKEQVEETLSHLQEFYHKLDTFTTQMAGAEEQEESQGPVGMETDFINQQLEAFKLSAAADPWRLMLPFFCLASVYLGGSTLLPQLLGQNHYCSQ
ncbi:dystonin-like [Tachysurus ichikawai]